MIFSSSRSIPLLGFLAGRLLLRSRCAVVGLWYFFKTKMGGAAASKVTARMAHRGLRAIPKFTTLLTREAPGIHRARSGWVLR